MMMGPEAPPLLSPLGNVPGLVVRPDQILCAFSIGTTREGAVSSTRALQAAFETLSRRLKEAIPRTTFRLRDMGGQSVWRSKAKALEGHSGLHGVIEIPLNESDSFWERAGWVATLQDHTALLDEEWLHQKPAIHSSFEMPRVSVRDPESFRRKLIDQWVERARDLILAAQTELFPLTLIDSQVPGPVAQQTLSLEEVRLTLNPVGRIDLPSREPLPPAKAAVAPA